MLSNGTEVPPFQAKDRKFVPYLIMGTHKALWKLSRPTDADETHETSRCSIDTVVVKCKPKKKRNPRRRKELQKRAIASDVAVVYVIVTFLQAH